MHPERKQLRRDLYGMGKTEARRLMDACGLTETEQRTILLCYIERMGMGIAASEVNLSERALTRSLGRSLDKLLRFGKIASL